MRRHTYQHNGMIFSYLDDDGPGQPLIALHAHWMEATTFEPLAAALHPVWRVIAPDQRGHGYTDHADSYTRQDYLDDLLAFFHHLEIPEAVLLGNSLGGVNAYQFAARYPDHVRALIAEEVGAEVHEDTSFALAWAGSYPSWDALAERVGSRLTPYLQDSFRETSHGWQLAFDPEDTVASQISLNGSHWDDWLASSCPALLLRGRDSRVSNADQMEQMVARRPNTTMKILPGGHVLHHDKPVEFTAAVLAFLETLPMEARSAWAS